ncbi:MAG: hypothetical protein Q9221_008678 [Calogaya cf. arnoldii]
MRFFLIFFAVVSWASASPLVPEQLKGLDPSVPNGFNPNLKSLNPCIGCGVVCAAVFAACAFVCVIPADPFCEACVATEDAALGDTCLTCLRDCFFPVKLARGDAALQKPSAERMAATTAAADSHIVPLNTNLQDLSLDTPIDRPEILTA